MDINKYMIDMKNLIEKSFFLVCCLLLVACGGEDLNKYKEQYLDAMAKDMKTTKEFLVKDLDVVIDSMRIIPITVADSIYLLEEFSKMDKKQIAKMKKEFKEYKKMEGLFMLFGGNNKVAHTICLNIGIEVKSFSKYFSIATCKRSIRIY